MPAVRPAFLILARLEGLSLLLLWGVAMPLKYLAGQPEAVRWVGLTHGVLFLAYVAALVVITATESWSMKRAALGLVASLFPAGTFLFEWSLRPEADPARA